MEIINPGMNFVWGEKSGGEFVMGVKNPGVKILKGVNIFSILG